MSNKVKEFTITIKCNEAFYRALMAMLKYAGKLGKTGASRNLGIYFDGDGADQIEILKTSHLFSEPIPARLGVRRNGDFRLDTDQVFTGPDTLP